MTRILFSAAFIVATGLPMADKVEIEATAELVK